MAQIENKTVEHIQEHFGIYHYKSIYMLMPFVENAFENGGNEDIKQCPMCQNFYAIALLYGGGVPKNTGKGIELLKAAASQGLAKSQANLARMYEDGKGVEADIAKAYELCKAAADQNDSSALERLPIIAKKYQSSQELDKVENLFRSK